MMRYITKNISLLLVLLALVILYLLVRTFHLTSLPIFTDESIYIRWAQIGLHDPTYRFLSLTDGKQPLFIWVMYPFFKLFHDPLVAGRMVSVFSGLFSMLGLGILSYTLFRKKTYAVLAMILYLFYPFAQVMDRMALYDSMVGMFYIWSLCVSILLVRTVRLDVAYTLGFILGMGILTKTSNFLSIYLLPVTLLLFNFRQKHWVKKILTWAGFAIISIVISQIMYGVLRLSPLANVINEKNNSFYYPFSEWIQHPFQYVIGNLHGMSIPLEQYLTIPYIVLVLVSLYFFKKSWKEKALLFAFFILPFVGFAFIAKSVFARYFFFMTLPLLPLAGWGLGYIFDYIAQKIRKGAIQTKLILLGVFFLFLIYPAYVTYSFAADPITAPIADADKTQYVDSWTGGWGLREVADYFEQKANEGPLFIATEGTFGLYPQGLELYISQNKNISIKGYYWEIYEGYPKEVGEKAKTMPTYFVFYQPCPVGKCDRPGDAPKDWPLKPIKEFTHPGTNTRVVIYQVTPNAQP